MSLKSGHRIIPVTGKDHEKQFKEFEGNRVGTIRLDPDGWFFTSPFMEYADPLYEFEYKPTDVVIMTYPKCGTTWTQELVWTIKYNPNLDHPKANSPISFRCPFVDFDFLLKNSLCPPLEPGEKIFDMFTKLLPDLNPKKGLFLQLAETVEDPRILKVHLPFSLLNPKLLDTCKVIYVARNPKDVCTSYLHHSRLLKYHNFVGTQDSFVDHFINDTLVYGPYWTHMKEAWTRREHPNLYFLFYEDMKEDPSAGIEHLSTFLGCSLTQKQIDDIAHYTSFESMKERNEELKEDHKMINYEVFKEGGGFFRKGQTGDWKNKLTECQAKRIDDWTKSFANEFDGDFRYTQISPQEI